ncbi:hypothetical protein COCVIDRAFT_108501 [Bipolaris victoriae FI3]|uniref:Xylanolytic transcriptional activator regulatory domain-containing protein n=1 Tax=Bipolaris victoriae (strain FI3) TaxID=930091 RepID=W7ECE0_BIPV3|nr:hypothetical protein COCVIDRAFT_108501 [Bipolaris victoriae FI3]
MDQFPAYILPDGQTNNSELYMLVDTTLPQGQLDLTGYEDFMGFPYPVSLGGEPMDGTTSTHLFPSMPRPEMQTNEPHLSPRGPGNHNLYKQQQGLFHGPNQPPTPPFTSPHIKSSLSLGLTNSQYASSPNKKNQDISIGSSYATDDVLGELVDVLARPDAWDGLPSNKSDSTMALSHDARDRLVATVQLLLQRALQIGSSPSSSTEGLFGRIVSLPPSHVLIHFIEIYTARIDSVQPYLGLPGSPTANIQDILNIDAVDVGMLLIILVITHGAMLTDHHESHVFAYGLIEVCMVALNHVLERRCISQAMVGGIALQLLTLCVRSGKSSFISYAMSKRGQYLSLLKSSGILNPEPGFNDHGLDSESRWERWKEIETKNRHVHAWVYVDLETSLLHDVPPVLSNCDLQVPLPNDSNLWNAQSYNDWIGQPGANEIQMGRELPSLNGLFRSFLQGRLTGSDDVPPYHLRLLLHPLQAMVLEQQQLLRIFDNDESTNRHRVLSKTKVLGRLQETQGLVQDLATLLNRHSQATMDSENKPWTVPVDWTGIIMLHLVSLNVYTSIPDIEKCAKEEPPSSASACAEMWSRVRYPEEGNYVLFHAGQIFRLIDNLPVDARPIWWPVAIYRASMACWSLRTIERINTGIQSREVGIDALLPSDEERFLNTPAVTPVVTFPDNRRLPIFEGGNSLLCCISKLENHPTHLVSSVLEKARYFLHRWS